MSAAFRGAALIRREALIRGDAYFNVDTQKYGAY